jgi:hypothetical protein
MSCNARIAGTAAFGAALLIGAGLSASPAQAAYVVTLTQEGPNVVASGSGTINTTDLTFVGAGSVKDSVIIPDLPLIDTGPAASTTTSEYLGTIAGPTSFGGGSRTTASSGSGDMVGVFVLMFVDVPSGYTSGSPLMDTSTYNNATFSSLGVTPGTYAWTWGSGANADSFTLKIGGAAVPEPATLGLLVLGLLGGAGAGFARRKRRS